MNDYKLKTLQLFPGLLCTDEAKHEYRGLIEYMDKKCVYVELAVPNFPKVHGIQYVVPTSQTNEMVVNDDADLCEFLNELKSTLCTNHKSRFRLCKFEQLVKDCESLTDENCTFDLNIKQHELSIQMRDIVIHCISIELDLNSNEQYFVRKHSFPEYKDTIYFPFAGNIMEIYDKFKQNINKLAEFYDAMSYIDELCWTLGTEDVSKSCIRRIVIDDGVSVQITCDPFNVKSLPDIIFFGPERLTSKYIKAYTENIYDWNPTLDLIQNILRMLDLPFFPVRPEEQSTDVLLFDNEECCICFSMLLDGKYPEVICENRTCEKYFHSDCLYQWLSALPTNRKLFSAIHGECPNCEKRISCKIPDT